MTREQMIDEAVRAGQRPKASKRSRAMLSPEQRAKDNARSYAGVYKRRGVLVPKPCEECGEPDSEMHHPDYSKPLEVVWLCRPCHHALHKAQEVHGAPVARRTSTFGWIPKPMKKEVTWRDFLSEYETKEMARIESTIEIARSDRRRLINRAFARMARDKVRRDGIRAINERIQAAG